MATLLAAMFLGGAADGDVLATHQITVTAADRAYPRAPLTATVPAPRGEVRSGTLTDVDSGVSVPVQLAARGGAFEATWIAEPLAQGQQRTYKLALGDEALPVSTDEGVQLSDVDGAVEIQIDGELFTRYCYTSTPKPYCYPVIGPTGEAVTRSFPMEEKQGEAQDHPHQRSWWFTHGEVNGVDFWAEGPECGREVHQAFEALQSGPVVGVLCARNAWVAADGREVCGDRREYRIYRMPDCRLVDMAVTLTAGDEPVLFGDTKEGTMGFRVAETMKVDAGEGHIVNANGERDGEAWGKSAPWCDYWGPVGDEIVGIAVLDHPESFRHPTYWHVRTYGLFAANPFGLRHFINDETGAGRYQLPPGESITFRYRIYIHRGDTDAGGVADVYAAFADPPKVTVR